MKHNGLLIIFFLSTLCLQGCVSTLMSGADVVYNRYEYTEAAKNQLLSVDANNTLAANKELNKYSTLNVSVFDYVALIIGRTSYPKYRDEAGKIVSQIKGIKRVVNAIEVGPPLSVSQDIKDSWITTKIKASFLASSKIDIPEIKVITENNTVFLMGIVTREQAKEATKIARNTAGVTKVIHVFQYIQLTDQ